MLWNLNHPLGNTVQTKGPTSVFLSQPTKTVKDKKKSEVLCRHSCVLSSCVCASQCVIACVCVHLFSSVCVCVCVCILQHVQLRPYYVCMQPCVSPIVLSGSDRVSSTVCERGDGREKIAALQLSSQLWLLSADYTAALLSTWKDMNRTTTTELNNTARQLESDTT